MSMYKGTRKFDRDQLVFMANVCLTSALDRVDCFTSCMDYDDYILLEKDIKSSVQSCIETAGASLAIFYAQVTGDGLGIGDAIDMIGLTDFVDKFIAKRVVNMKDLSVDTSPVPDCLPLAESFVNQLFDEYLEIKKKKYNHGMTVGFEVISEDSKGATRAEITEGLKRRCKDLLSMDDENFFSCFDIFDTHVESDRNSISVGVNGKGNNIRIEGYY